MNAAEIIAELPRLNSRELAQVQAKLSELVAPARTDAAPNPVTAPPARIYSPRLAYPEQSKDFVKQIVELAPDAKL